MKKTCLLFALTLIVIVSFNALANAASKSWRVNNNATGDYGENLGGSASFPVFGQLDEAQRSILVNEGDTLYLEGSATNYNPVDIQKKLIIIGPGYFLNENPKASTDALPASILYITFNSGSAGSQLIGVSIYGSDGVNIYVSNIIVKRCIISASVSLTYGLSSITIRENFFANSTKNDNTAVRASSDGFASDFIFDNNICQRVLILSNSTTTYTAKECNNNIFDCPPVSSRLAIKLNTASFKNNILTNTIDTVNINSGNYTNVDYNISASPTKQFGTGSHNILVTNFSTLFVSSGTTDGKYQLQTNLSAEYKGSDGTERGVFGGLAPSGRYTLSGLPSIPVIYAVTTPGTAANSLPVTISARIIK